MPLMPSNTVTPAISSASPFAEKRQDSLTDRELTNLESHQLIWLDSSMDTKESQITLHNLRKVVDYTKLFDNVEECERYILEKKDTITFLVTSGALGQNLIPRINDLGNIRQIFVYCRNKDFHQQWAELNINFKREKDGLFSEIIRKENTTGRTHSSWISFIDLLCHLPYPEDARFKLINSLKEYYKGKDTELKILAEFLNYTPDQAIRWYTRPTFLFQLLNRALRQQDTTVMFLFGFFIQDIYRQLKAEHEKFKLAHLEKNPIFTVFRGQFISMAEIPSIVTRPDNPLYDFLNYCIVNNSFLSTTLDSALARILTNPSRRPSIDPENVIFEITVDTCLNTRPFADISHLSYIRDEREILFMIGTVFIAETGTEYYDENEKIWHIKLSLTSEKISEDDRNFNAETQRETLKIGVTAITQRLAYANIENIDIVYNELINLYPSENAWILACKYHCYGLHQRFKLNNFTAALSNFEKALEKWYTFLDDVKLNCFFDIGHLRKAIGSCYHDKSYEKYDPDTAMRYLDQAIDYYKLALERATRDEEQIKIFYALEKIFELAGQVNCDKNAKNCYFSMECKYIELGIEKRLQYYSPNDKHLRDGINTLCFYYGKKLEDEVLLAKHCETVLRALLQHPNPYFNTIIYVTDKLLEIYSHVPSKDTELKLKYQLIQHQYKLREYEPKSWDNVVKTNVKKTYVARNHTDLFYTYESLFNYDEALRHSEKALEIYLSQSLQVMNNLYSTFELFKTVVDMYNERLDYDSTLKYLLIKIEYILSWHSSISIDREITNETQKDLLARSYIELARCYLSLHRYDEAVASYETVLEICQQQRCLDFTLIDYVTLELTSIQFENKHDYQLALKYQLLLHEYTHELLKCALDHVCENDDLNRELIEVAKSHERLANIYIRLKQYKTAYEHFLSAVETYQHTTYSYLIGGIQQRIETLQLAISSSDYSSVLLHMSVDYMSELRKARNILFDMENTTAMQSTFRSGLCQPELTEDEMAKCLINWVNSPD
ncbi:unnamed protein product [Didymodactylos carnosus]|uniref:Uncharacterized protein n=1 Tax=Didymodactylos carnosus TaxID=1234261 RepID=A0A814M848_9BILA|nr:unnamed protein product [Didymodactylos carnosus]CAF3842478.1 unnamed protein product [Didymodactylos carnosus]